MGEYIDICMPVGVITSILKNRGACRRHSVFSTVWFLFYRSLCLLFTGVCVCFLQEFFGQSTRASCLVRATDTHSAMTEGTFSCKCI
jgi:hypothetical protein